MLQSLKEFFLIPVQFFQHATKLTYAALAFTTVIGILYFKIMSRRRHDFAEQPTVDYTQPVEQEWLKLKLMALLLVLLVSYLAAYYQFPEWFPSLFAGR